MSENSNLNPLTNFLLKERVSGDGGGASPGLYTLFLWETIRWLLVQEVS